MSCRRRKLKGIDDIPSAKTGPRITGNPSQKAGPKDALESDFSGLNGEGGKNVVEWWQDHRRENGVEDSVGDTELTIPTSNANVTHERDEIYSETLRYDLLPSSRSSQVTDTWEHNESGVQLRPYNNPNLDYSNPKNGMILDPSMLPIESEKERVASVNPSAGIFVTRGRSLDSSDGIQFFQAQLEPPSGTIEQGWKLGSEHLDLPASNNKNDTTASTFPMDESEDQSLTSFEAQTPKIETESSNIRKKLSLSQFIAKKSKPQLLTSKRASPTEFSDHLSDVPSHVDPVTRERYLLACQMLKETIIRKESARIPVEKDYILSLLEDFETHSVDGTELSVDHISSIERAVQQLENDSILEDLQDSANVHVPSPTTAARAQRSRGVLPVNPMLPSSDKNPHTATRSPKKNPHTATARAKNLLDQVVSNGCNPGSVPNLLRGTGLPSNLLDRGRLARFDGWAVQNLLEYPFAILDTGGYHTNQKVFTPGVMEALRNFMPMNVMHHNFWLRYSMPRDGRSFTKLLASVRASTYTLIGIETNLGEVFGSFTATPWKIGSKWYGSRKSFLWRLKQARYTTARNLKDPHFEREIEVYPCTEDDDLIQYCTAKTIAVGGGEWQHNVSPFRGHGEGIGLVIDGDLAGGETNTCATFANPKLARFASSSNEFVINNLEVWTMTPSNTVEDATTMEMREFFLRGYD